MSLRAAEPLMGQSEPRFYRGFRVWQSAPGKFHAEYSRLGRRVAVTRYTRADLTRRVDELAPGITE